MALENDKKLGLHERPRGVIFRIEAVASSPVDAE